MIMLSAAAEVDAGLDQLQAREEPADLSLRTGRDRGGGLRVVPLHALGHLVSGNGTPSPTGSWLPVI